MRNFIRHASDIPINVHIESRKAPIAEKAVNISSGGILFLSDLAIDTGNYVSISMPDICSTITLQGEVVWCRKEHDSQQYNVGIQFSNDTECFNARMIEQICYIESYKKYILEKEGRELSSDGAANEWINKYADKFPDIYGYSTQNIIHHRLTG